ncbi:MAG: hypothetical protein WBC06_18520 [Chitinophagaceae bacterium]
MLKNWFILLVFLLQVAVASSQKNVADTAIAPADDFNVIDTSINYEELFRDFDAFMDSILTPRSYFLSSLTIGKGFYNFEGKSSFLIESSKKLTYSPTLGYYHKSGLGITTNGYIVDDGKNMNLYQVAISPSYDFLKDKKFATGISYTRYITKDSLPFYTTPLKNDIYAYFTYRKWWIRPMLALSYGWGSRTDFEQREILIQDLRLRRRGFTYINTEEKVSDFSLSASVRHDFYWLDIFNFKDHIRFTPQFTFTSGTQKFGFNQSSSTYATSVRNNNSVIYNTDNLYLDDELKFQPLSLTLCLRGEYSIGKFFIQPQFTMDYYLPVSTERFNAFFSMTAGLIF